MMRNVLKTMVVVLALSSAATASSGSPDGIEVIKIAPRDARAVIKEADGKLKVIKPGDQLGEGWAVKEIVSGTVVLEQKTGKEAETVIVRMVNGKAKVEHMRKEPLAAPALMMPTRGGN